MKKEKSCGCIVIDKNQVLIIRHNKGHRGFPKGHVEEGETEEETAKREVLEETGIKVTIENKKRYMMTYSPKENVEKDVIYFIAKPINFNTKNQEEEVSIAKFVSLEEAETLLTYENSRDLFKKVLKDIK